MKRELIEKHKLLLSQLLVVTNIEELNNFYKQIADNLKNVDIVTANEVWNYTESNIKGTDNNTYPEILNNLKKIIFKESEKNIKEGGLDYIEFFLKKNIIDLQNQEENIKKINDSFLDQLKNDQMEYLLFSLLFLDNFEQNMDLINKVFKKINRKKNDFFRLKLRCFENLLKRKGIREIIKTFDTQDKKEILDYISPPDVIAEIIYHMERDKIERFLGQIEEENLRKIFYYTFTIYNQDLNPDKEKINIFLNHIIKNDNDLLNKFIIENTTEGAKFTKELYEFIKQQENFKISIETLYEIYASHRLMETITYTDDFVKNYSNLTDLMNALKPLEVDNDTNEAINNKTAIYEDCIDCFIKNRIKQYNNFSTEDLKIRNKDIKTLNKNSWRPNDRLIVSYLSKYPSLITDHLMDNMIGELDYNDFNMLIKSAVVYPIIKNNIIEKINDSELTFYEKIKLLIINYKFYNVISLIIKEIVSYKNLVINEKQKPPIKGEENQKPLAAKHSANRIQPRNPNHNKLTI